MVPNHRWTGKARSRKRCACDLRWALLHASSMSVLIYVIARSKTLGKLAQDYQEMLKKSNAVDDF